MSFERMILRAVHQSFANNRNENMIHPLKIHREILRSIAGLTWVAHLLNASKKMAIYQYNPEGKRWEGRVTSLGVEDVDSDGFKDIDENPQVTCPEKFAVSGKRFDVDEIEFMILDYLALPLWTHPLSERSVSLSIHDRLHASLNHNKEWICRQFDHNTTIHRQFGFDPDDLRRCSSVVSSVLSRQSEV